MVTDDDTTGSAPEEEAFGEQPPPELVVITGMSGAGRSEAIHAFEDLGYFCIDNLPPALIEQLVSLTTLPGSRIRRVAVVCDVRGREFFDEINGALTGLEKHGQPFRLLFLEAEDKTLVNRFKETRRRHPLAAAGSVSAGIKSERKILEDVRSRADFILDTSDFTPQQLRDVIRERFVMESRKDVLTVTVSSFGFKYGVPIDSDIVMDVRFLPNPFYDPKLRNRTGLDRQVRSFVLGQPETARFLESWFDLLKTVMPGYLVEGKTHLVVALGCTGGMHRSVVLAEKTAERLRELGYQVSVSHRDIGNDRVRR